MNLPLSSRVLTRKDRKVPVSEFSPATKHCLAALLALQPVHQKFPKTFAVQLLRRRCRVGFQLSSKDSGGCARTALCLRQRNSSEFPRCLAGDRQSPFRRVRTQRNETRFFNWNSHHPYQSSSRRSCVQRKLVGKLAHE